MAVGENSQYVKIGKGHTNACTTADTTMTEGTQIVTIWRWVIKIPHEDKPSNTTEKCCKDHHRDAEFGLIGPFVPFRQPRDNPIPHKWAQYTAEYPSN